MIPENLLPKGTKWCIAGGYAACPALACDIDVWVYGVRSAEDSLQIRRAEILLHIAKAGFRVVTETGDNVANDGYEDKDISILKVGRVDQKDGLPIHVMVTDATTPERLLESFDISTHAVAVGPGFVVKAAGWTPPHVPPVAFGQHATTTERMVRIATRFGHKIRYDRVEGPVVEQSK